MYEDRVHLLLYWPFLLAEDKRLYWLGFGLILNPKVSRGCHARIAVSPTGHSQFPPFSPTSKAWFPLHLNKIFPFSPINLGLSPTKFFLRLATSIIWNLHAFHFYKNIKTQKFKNNRRLKLHQELEILSYNGAFRSTFGQLIQYLLFLVLF